MEIDDIASLALLRHSNITEPHIVRDSRPFHLSKSRPNVLVASCSSSKVIIACAYLGSASHEHSPVPLPNPANLAKHDE